MRSPGSSCVERQRSDMSPLILATIALTSLMVTIGRGGLSINGSLLMTYPLRPVVALALGFLVTACGGGGSVVPTPPPEAPGSFTAELTPNHEALLRWTAPTPSPDRAPVTGYAVYLESAGGLARRLGDTQSLSYLHPGLLPGTRYVFHVYALSDRGASLASASAFVDVPGVPILPIAVPHVTVRADQGGGSALISWIHLAPELPTVVAGFSVQYCNVVPNHMSDHCDPPGWQDHRKSPLPPAERVLIDEDHWDCEPLRPLERVARMYRMRALAGDDPSASSRYSDPTRPICPSARYSPRAASWLCLRRILSITGSISAGTPPSPTALR